MQERRERQHADLITDWNQINIRVESNLGAFRVLGERSQSDLLDSS
jgi:hypothetical protein